MNYIFGILLIPHNELDAVDLIDHEGSRNE